MNEVNQGSDINQIKNSLKEELPLGRAHLIFLDNFAKNRLSNL